jgi:hypothetical protein
MAITRVNPSGWATNATVTSAQLNTLDTAITTALDKTVAGDTLAGRVQLSGAGRIAQNVANAADANTTYAVGSFTELRVTSALTANRTYTLSATGAISGDVIAIGCDVAFGFVATVLDQSSAALITIGNGSVSEASWCEALYNGTGWVLRRSSKGAAFTQAFTANGTWTCPPGVTAVRLYGCGGGGGGGGGSGASYSGNTVQGGAGGGGAIASHATVTVTPGASYSVTIGLGGLGGAGGANSTTGVAGSAGTDTSFGALLTIYGAGGGAGGIYNSTPTPPVAIGGSALRLISSGAAGTAAGQGGSNGSAGVGAAVGPMAPGAAGAYATGVTPAIAASGGGAGSLIAVGGSAGGTGGTSSTSPTIGYAGYLGGGGGGGGVSTSSSSSTTGMAGGAGGAGYLRLDWVR